MDARVQKVVDRSIIGTDPLRKNGRRTLALGRRDLAVETVGFRWMNLARSDRRRFCNASVG
jgi:hypothetical protein